MKHAFSKSNILSSLLIATAAWVVTERAEAAVFPPTPAEPLPTVDQILDKFVEALGGKAKLENLTSRVMKGNADLPGAGGNAPVEIYEKAPNKRLVILNNPDLTVNATCFNGTTGWSEDPDSGVRDLSGDELASTARDAEFHRAIKFKELYPKMAVKGAEKVDEHNAYLLEATPAGGGSSENWYFDAQTGLLLRRTWHFHAPDGDQAMEISFDDYREVDGVKVPFTIRQSFSDDFLTIKLSEVQDNVAIDDAKFSKPKAQ